LLNRLGVGYTAAVDTAAVTALAICSTSACVRCGCIGSDSCRRARRSARRKARGGVAPTWGLSDSSVHPAGMALI